MKQQFPRTKLYLTILRQELISLEGLSKLPATMANDSTMAEMRRMEVVQQSIEEIETLLELADGDGRSSGWVLSQYWLVFLVMVASGLLVGSGLWASLILR